MRRGLILILFLLLTMVSKAAIRDTMYSDSLVLYNYSINLYNYFKDSVEVKFDKNALDAKKLWDKKLSEELPSEVTTAFNRLHTNNKTFPQHYLTKEFYSKGVTLTVNIFKKPRKASEYKKLGSRRNYQAIDKDYNYYKENK